MSFILVPVAKFKRIIKKARKWKANVHGIIISKLMPLLFSQEEMASSGGQGIKPSGSDKMKPPLNPRQLTALKGIVDVFHISTSGSGSDKKKTPMN